MNHILAIIILTFPSSIPGHSPGTQLSTIVQNMFVNVTETSDLCILFDSANWIWQDLLDDFVPNLPGKFAVNRLSRSGYPPRSCAIHLVFLKPTSNPTDFDVMAERFLEADFWNRYGKFVFVTVQDANLTVLLFNLYGVFVETLGIINAVLIFIGKVSNMVIRYDYFGAGLEILGGVDAVGGVLMQDFPRNINGHSFNALFSWNAPFLIWNPSYEVSGIEAQIAIEFCRHVNATLNIKIPKKQFPTPSEFSQILVDGSVSVVNGLVMVPKFT